MNISDTVEDRVAQLEARLADLADREAIRDVIYRYCRGADRCDIELFKSCYWPDATDCHGFFNGKAHAFAEWVIPHLAEIQGSVHSITNVLIEIEGSRAFVDSQWRAFHVIPVDEERFIFQQGDGHYLDVMEKRDGEWRILHRTYTAENGLEQVRPAFARIPEEVMPQPANAARAPHDLSYKRFSILDLEIVPINGHDLWADARERLAGQGVADMVPGAGVVKG